MAHPRHTKKKKKSTHDISIPNYEIGDLARDVRVACDNTMGAVNGERYSNAGWRVIVHSYAEC